MAVRYDDRLRTVLGHPAETPHERAIRWRQLVELIARVGDRCSSELVDSAIAAVREDMGSVDEHVRMAAARAVAPLPLPLHLVQAFAADRLAVAAPVLAAARLTVSEWSEVASNASSETRHFIAALRGEAAAEAVPSHPMAEPPPATTGRPVPSISELVARIEKLRQARAKAEEKSQAPAQLPKLFRWECDESGEIDWIDGAPRGPLIGRWIARPGTAEALGPDVERAFADRSPFQDARLELTAGTPVAGIWKVSGKPEFEPATGRFAGYRGIAEREVVAAVGPASLPDPDTIRDLVHEIRTPLNAIIGFAEIIDGQYLGPADDRYRERAGEIVAQARLLLGAVEDLDLAASLQSEVRTSVPSTEIAGVVELLTGDLEEIASARASRFTFEVRVPATCALAPELTQRLLLRFCGTVLGAATESDVLFEIEADDRYCRVSVAEPVALRGFETEGAARDQGQLALRLVQGLARIVGGDVTESGECVTLLLPKA